MKIFLYENQTTILTVLLIISLFVSVHLYAKLKTMRNFGEGVLEKLQDCWDVEYKNIVAQYGNTKNFLSLMTSDFREVRKTGASYLAIYKASLEKIDSLCETKSNMTKADLLSIINNVKIISAFSAEEADSYLDFLTKEEKLHDFEEKVNEYYNEIKAHGFDEFTVVANKPDDKSDEDKN